MDKESGRHEAVISRIRGRRRRMKKAWDEGEHGKRHDRSSWLSMSVDEFQIVVNPIVLGKGRTMFEGVKDRLNFKRTSTRTFGNGNTVLCYEPAP